MHHKNLKLHKIKQRETICYREKQENVNNTELKVNTVLTEVYNYFKYTL